MLVLVALEQAGRIEWAALAALPQTALAEAALVVRAASLADQNYAFRWRAVDSLRGSRDMPALHAIWLR